MVEVRNGSGQSKQQWVFGTQYTDEIVLMDNTTSKWRPLTRLPPRRRGAVREATREQGSPTRVKGDPGVTLMEEVAEPGDQRFFYHQDRNWNVVALTTMATADEMYSDGEVVERCAYSPYGEPTVIAVTPPLGRLVDSRLLPIRNRRREWLNDIRQHAVGGHVLRNPK